MNFPHSFKRLILLKEHGNFTKYPNETSKSRKLVLGFTGEFNNTQLNKEMKQLDVQNLLSKEMRRRHDAEQKIHRDELQTERME